MRSCDDTFGTSSANTTAKPLKIQRRHKQYIKGKRDGYARVQVPVDVAVEEPGTWIIGEEPNCDIITGVADAHDIPDNRIDKVVRGVAGAADNVEGMTMQVNRVLYRGRGELR
jgi:hypothetical protein